MTQKEELRFLARVYAIREPHEQGATDVITSTFTLLTIPLFSLIDFGFTHSYVLSKLDSELGILVETIDKGVTVTSSFGDSVLVDIVYRRCSLEVQGQVFYVKLMEFSFYGFDMILGMDWLIEHRAKIDFELKKRLYEAMNTRKLLWLVNELKLCLAWSQHLRKRR